MFQDEAPLLRKHAHPARTQTRTLWPSTWLSLKAMGAGPAGRITYAAASRLDGIGRRAMGDMVSSAVASSELALLLRKRPAEALSREIEIGANSGDHTIAVSRTQYLMSPASIHFILTKRRCSRQFQYSTPLA